MILNPQKNKLRTNITRLIGSIKTLQSEKSDLEKAKKLISKSKKAGADLVKFQMWRAKDLYSKNHQDF